MIVYVECGNDLILLTGPSNIINITFSEENQAEIVMADVAEYVLEGPAEIQAFLNNLLKAGVEIHSQIDTLVGKYVVAARKQL